MMSRFNFQRRRCQPPALWFLADVPVGVALFVVAGAA